MARHSDLPADYDPELYELDSSWGPLPPALVGHGIYIQGHNRSDDLFMFLKVQVDGLEPNTAYVVEEECSGCKTCLSLCPYSAISRDDEKEVAVINEVLMPASVSFGILFTAVVVSIAVGVLAGLVPAVQASRRNIVTCFRAV